MMNKGYTDLHTHTNLSDGVLAPEALVQKAVSSGIRVLAVTDHNMIMDTEMFDSISEKYADQIQLVRGTEVSAFYTAPDGRKVEVHVPALDFDPAKMDFVKAGMRGREAYVNAIRDRLADFDMMIPSFKELQKIYPDSGHIGRMHIARYMADHHYTVSADEALDKYIGAFGERRAYVDGKDYQSYAPLADVVRNILAADGIPVLAHLFYYRLDEAGQIRLVKAFKELAGPLAAMEVYYGIYSGPQRQYLKKLADEYGLLYSAGSDFHGQSETDTLDNHFPVSVWENMQSRKAELKKM